MQTCCASPATSRAPIDDRLRLRARTFSTHGVYEKHTGQPAGCSTPPEQRGLRTSNLRQQHRLALAVHFKNGTRRWSRAAAGGAVSVTEESQPADKSGSFEEFLRSTVIAFCIAIPLVAAVCGAVRGAQHGGKPPETRHSLKSLLWVCHLNAGGLVGAGWGFLSGLAILLLGAWPA